jgi:hypothetical protein
MRVLHDFAIDGNHARSLAILLPGALQQPEDFVKSGFVDAVRKRKLSIDLALVDPGIQFIGEAIDGSALQRIHEQVVLPAVHANYREIWLVGISISGFLAIAHADKYPDPAIGLCLLAPYPGNRMITGEISVAGGLGQWQPDFIENDDAEHKIWHWLKTYRQHAPSTRVHLGFGLEDRFAPAHRMMAEVLDANCVDTVAGGHDWPAWQHLWENFLDRRMSPFAQPDQEK